MHTRDALSFLLFACQWLALVHAAPLTGGSVPARAIDVAHGSTNDAGNRAEAIVKPAIGAISTENSLRKPNEKPGLLASLLGPIKRQTRKPKGPTKPKPKPKSAPKIVPEVAKPVTDTVELVGRAGSALIL
ncbi:hypothetical protein BKA70DRAFT_1346632 [Coprinopsis sp. MPI-PUGE-AT-0042]|nr:hypothetical protein BKA70DRAFT_1346632 [Coprinopsis sp. MPI-PUGE-AT-0042]